jgi:hypothetical protein
MGELYEAVLSNVDGVRLKMGHWFDSLMGEYAAGDITGQEATTAFENLAGRPLTGTMQTEIQDLIGTVTAISVPAAPTKPAEPAVGANVATVRTYAISVSNYADVKAARAEGLAARAHKIRRITGILTLAQDRAPGYNTAAELRTRLGVPTR